MPMYCFAHYFITFESISKDLRKTKKHVLTFKQEYDFLMIGLSSHHNDYRLAWAMNETLSISLTKCPEDFVVVNKKGQGVSNHSLYEFRDQENLLEYFLVKNKSLGSYLIPEKPMMDYFLFLFDNQALDPSDLLLKLRTIPIILGGYLFDPEEFESTEIIVFN